MYLGFLAQSRQGRLDWDLRSRVVGQRRRSVLATYVFGRQALPMIWDFAEVNPFSASRNWESLSGSMESLESSSGSLWRRQCRGSRTGGCAESAHCDGNGRLDRSPVLRQHRLRGPFGLFLCLASPDLKPIFPDSIRDARGAQGRRAGRHPIPAWHAKKEAESVLSGRHDAGDASASRATRTRPFPSRSTTLSSNRKREASWHVSTGWETFLEAVIQAGFAITGTWPMRTERGNRDDRFRTNERSGFQHRSCLPPARRRRADRLAAANSSAN